MSARLLILAAVAALTNLSAPAHARETPPMSAAPPAFAEVMGLFAARTHGRAAFTD